MKNLVLLILVLAACGVEDGDIPVTTTTNRAAEPESDPTPVASVVPQETRRLIHLSGCEDDGELVLTTIRIWETAERSGLRSVGRLSGTGEAGRCQGAIVKILGIDSVAGAPRTMFMIESVVNGLQGWVSELTIGNEFPRSLCRTHFADEAAATMERCEAP